MTAEEVVMSAYAAFGAGDMDAHISSSKRSIGRHYYFFSSHNFLLC